MPERTVVYLDILGFKSYTHKSVEGAAQLLLNYHEIINTSLIEMARFPAARNPNPSLRNLALVREVGSFESFLPLSDSIFVISDQPDLLVPQISRFLIDSFTLTSDAFAEPEIPTDPSSVTIQEFSLRGHHPRTQHWFPLLFQGGIAVGEVLTPQVTSIFERKTMSTTNLAGTAVVEAVGIQKLGKGPRLFCTKDFHNRLSPDTKSFLAEVVDGYFEVLWPAFVYLESSHPDVEINSFHELFRPAVNLWHAFRADPKVEPHYREFLKLIIRGTRRWFGQRDSIDLADREIERRISDLSLQNIRAELVAA